MLKQRPEGVLLQREKCPEFADEKARLGQNLGVASGDPSLQDNKKLIKWKPRDRLRQCILGVTESYYHASPVQQIMNLDTGDNSYQYKHDEDNFKTAPASMMDLGGLTTMWEDLHELGSILFGVPERNVPARNNCDNCDDRAERRSTSTDSNTKPPLEWWADLKSIPYLTHIRKDEASGFPPIEYFTGSRLESFHCIRQLNVWGRCHVFVYKRRARHVEFPTGNKNNGTTSNVPTGNEFFATAAWSSCDKQPQNKRKYYQPPPTHTWESKGGQQQQDKLPLLQREDNDSGDSDTDNSSGKGANAPTDAPTPAPAQQSANASLPSAMKPNSKPQKRLEQMYLEFILKFIANPAWSKVIGILDSD